MCVCAKTRAEPKWGLAFASVFMPSFDPSSSMIFWERWNGSLLTSCAPSFGHSVLVSPRRGKARQGKSEELPYWWRGWYYSPSLPQLCRQCSFIRSLWHCRKSTSNSLTRFCPLHDQKDLSLGKSNISFPFFPRESAAIIPSVFFFLVLLSYERYHSKQIIGIPKIIQLCDGIMASGRKAVTHGNFKK